MTVVVGSATLLSFWLAIPEGYSSQDSSRTQAHRHNVCASIHHNDHHNYSFSYTQAADDESYGGPHPFSEPESRIVKLIAESAPVRASVNIHSGEYALYVPWDSRPDYGPDLPVSATCLLNLMHQQRGSPRAMHCIMHGPHADHRI